MYEDSNHLFNPSIEDSEEITAVLVKLGAPATAPKPCGPARLTSPMGGAASAEKKGSGLTASTGDLETVAPPDRSAHLPRAARPSHNVIGSGSSAAAQVQTQHASPAKPKQRHNSLPSTEVERMKFDEAHSVKESRRDAIEALRGGASSPAPEDIPRSSSRMGENGRRYSMPATEAERVAAGFAQQRRGAGLKQQVARRAARPAPRAAPALHCPPLQSGVRPSGSALTLTVPPV